VRWRTKPVEAIKKYVGDTTLGCEVAVSVVMEAAPQSSVRSGHGPRGRCAGRDQPAIALPVSDLLRRAASRSNVFRNRQAEDVIAVKVCGDLCWLN
jgi:hypothetical protein